MSEEEAALEFYRYIIELLKKDEIEAVEVTLVNDELEVTAWPREEESPE